MKRVLTALLLIPAVVGLIFYGHVLLVRAAVALVALLCLHECLNIARKMELRPYGAPAVAAGALIVLVPALPHLAFFVALTLLLLLLPLGDKLPLDRALPAVSATLFAVVYCCGPFALAAKLHELSPHWMFLVLVVSWVSDSAAFFVGKAIGRRKLAPRLSPGKTWEGAIGSAVLGTAAGYAYLEYAHPIELVGWAMAAMPLCINVAGQFGDLAESALKRGAGVKDSGSLLPGHGGMLDRMDGTLFAFPAAYVFLLFLQRLG